MKRFVGLATLAWTVFLPLMLMTSGSSFGQDVVQDVIEEIIVTATKRGETLLQETPLSITAFSANDLERSHLESLRDISQYTPGLTIANNQSYAQLYIRGIGSNNVFPGSDPSSTVHLDGVYLARPLMVFTDFLDLERIEVLRGPQGTLYGRNSVGGTINIIPRLPSNELRLRLSGEYGKFDKRKFVGNLSGPVIADKLFAGISFLRNKRDGYVDNINPDTTISELNDQNTTAVRGTLRFTPSETLEAVISADYFEADENSNVQKPFHIDDFGNPVFIPIPGFSPTVISDPWTTSLPGGDEIALNKLETYGFMGKLIARFPSGLRLTSISAYRDVEFEGRNDSDWTDVPAIGPFIGIENQDQFSQEFQLTGQTGKLDWLFGLFYLTEDDSFTGRGEAPLFGLLFSGFTTTDFLSLNDATVETDAYAAYARGTYSVTDQLTVTVGVRYSYEEKSIESSAAVFLAGFEIPPLGFSNTDSNDWDAWTPKFGIDYKVNDDVLVYASATKGFKSGGFNFSTDQDEFDPESLWAYEVGLKSDLADKRLRLNASAFYYNYTDLQVQTFKDVSGGGTPSVILKNAASATVKGLELEITALPTPHLMLSASVAYLDATYDKFITARNTAPDVPVDVSGNVLNNAPEWTYHVAAQYSRAVGDYGTLSIDASYSWQDDVFFNSQFNAPGMQQSSYGLLYARVGFRTRDDKWEFSVFGNNLTDEAYYTDKANFSPLGIFGHITPPRTVGVKLTYEY